MIAAARKTPILRSVLIVAVTLLVFAGTGYLYFDYKRAPNLSNNVDATVGVLNTSAAIDTCIYRLYDADNNNRLYALTGENSYLKRSYADMVQVLNTIDKTKFSGRGTADPAKFKKLVQEKINKNYDYIKLRLLTDDLIKNSGDIGKSLKSLQVVKPQIIAHHIKTVNSVNIKPTNVQRKKKFLDRVIASLSKLKESRNPNTTVVTKDTVIYSQQLSTAARHNGIKAYYYYTKLDAANKQLIVEEKNILKLNNEIIASLKAYKDIEQASTNPNDAGRHENLNDVSTGVNNSSAFNFVLLAFVCLIVLYNIWQMFRSKPEAASTDNTDDTDQYNQLKNKLLADMSQEMQRPLNSMIGATEQLSQENLQPHQKEQVVALRNSSEMILSMVNEFSELSNYESDEMNPENAPFMLNQAIAEVCGILDLQATQKGIRLENLNKINNNICCKGDRMRLKLVLTTLVSNAIKFAQQGKVVVHANTMPAAAGNIKLRVSVLDTGISIDKADLPHVFDESSQVAPARNIAQQKRTGLGLAFCKKIIEHQGGSISVVSTPCEGTVFSFELPLKMVTIPARRTDSTRSYSAPQR